MHRHCFPKAWRVEPFPKVVFDKSGGNAKVKQHDYLVSGALPVIDQGKKPIGGYVDDISLRCNVPLPCIVFGDHTKTFKFVEEPFAMGADGIKVLVPSKELDPKYLFYYFQQVKLPNDMGYSRHFKFLKEVTIPIPTLEIQREIAGTLDQARGLIEKRKRQIEIMDEFVQNLFLDMFMISRTDSIRPLTEFCTINPSKKELADLNGGTMISFLPMEAVSETGDILFSETRELSEVRKGYTYFREGDVLFAKITPSMENGKGAIAEGLISGIGFGSTEFHVLRPKKEITNTWLYHLTATRHFRKLAEASMTGSAGQKRVPKHFFDSFLVSAPPVALQQRFDEIVQHVEIQKHLMKQSLIKMENNFNSLMQRAFRGELFS